MKSLSTYILTMVAALLLSGCVVRTVTEQPAHRGVKADGSPRKQREEVREKKMIWIWEDQYRNAK